VQVHVSARGRSRARPRKSHRPTLFDPGVIEEIWNGFADLGDLEPHAIDSSNQTPAETARVIDDRLTAGELRV
jgi:hypothetical protein